MTELSSLKGLLERVEGAKEGSRELDEQLAMRLAGFKPTITVGHEVLGNLRQVPQHSPRYTSSLDAALGLVKRLLPEQRIVIDIPASPDVKPSAAIGPGGGRLWGLGHTEALALLSALLRALISQEEQGLGSSSVQIERPSGLAHEAEG